MLSLALRLFIAAKMNPAAWDAIIPHGPKYSAGAIHVFASQIVKSVSESIENPQTSRQLESLGGTLYTSGVGAMSYDDDNWCGTPYPHHHFVLEPEPSPWFEQTIIQSKSNSFYGGILSIVAQSISNKQVASELSEISGKLMGETRMANVM